MTRTSVRHYILQGLGAVAIVAALPACTVGPNYQRPEQNLGTAYRSAATQPATRPASHLGRNWWTLFGDPTLNDLETAAIQANPTIEVAYYKVLEARSSVKITQAGYYPIITADPSVTYARTVSPGTPRPAINSNTGPTYLLPFDLTYEVDIWGQVRRSVEQQKALAQAAADDFEVMLQIVEANVAEDYFMIRALDDQARILDENVADYHKQVDLLTTQLRAGLLSRLDVLQAQTLLDSTITQQIDIQRQRIDQEHNLAILLGRTPAELKVSIKPLDLVPPEVPASLPAELLRRRPDVAEAEQNLIAANAQVGVSKSALFPQLNLVGSAGYESFDVKRVFNWEDRVWSIGASLSAPIFEGGRLTAGLQQAREHYQEVAATYRSTVLGAIRDAEVALTDLHRYADEVAAQQRAVASAGEYLRLSEVQYHQGLINYLTVIDAQRTLLTNEQLLSQLVQSRVTAAVVLIKAVGGGWDAQAKEAANPTIPTTQPTTQPTTVPASQPATRPQR